MARLGTPRACATSRPDTLRFDTFVQMNDYVRIWGMTRVAVSLHPLVAACV